jgi:hypothetical protein
MCQEPAPTESGEKRGQGVEVPVGMKIQDFGNTRDTVLSFELVCSIYMPSLYEVIGNPNYGAHYFIDLRPAIHFLHKSLICPRKIMKNS